MHMRIYQERPDVNAVVHNHSMYATVAASIKGMVKNSLSVMDKEFLFYISHAAGIGAVTIHQLKQQFDTFERILLDTMSFVNRKIVKDVPKLFYKLFTDEETIEIVRNGVSIPGDPAYFIDLNNDSDVIVFDNTGAKISNLPIVIATRYIGNISSPSTGYLELTSPSEIEWEHSTIVSDNSEKGYYDFSNDTLEILQIPKDFSYGNFTFTWKDSQEGVTVYDQNTFTLKKIVSTVDYVFNVPEGTNISSVTISDASCFYQDEEE